MLKAVGLFLILTGGSGMGYAFSRQLTGRYTQLKELQRLIMLLEGEIAYNNAPLPEALTRVAGRLNEPFRAFLASLSREMTLSPQATMGQLFGRHVQSELQISFLNQDDKTQLCRLGEVLGYLDRDMLLKNLRLYQAQLQQEITDLWENMAGRKKLYQTLGIMGGLFLVILLI